MKHILLVLLLIVPLASAAETPVVGPLRIVSDAPVALQAPAVGDDFIAWISIVGGTGDVHIRPNGGTKVFAVTDGTPGQESNDALAGGAGHLIWTRSRLVNTVSGEGQQVQTDLVIYDVDRRAEIYDSRSPEVEEGVPIIGDEFYGYLSNERGVQQVFVGRYSGSSAFIPASVESGGDQFQPAMDGTQVVFKQATDIGQQVVAVDVPSQSRLLLAPPISGVGYASPAIGDGRIAWVEHEGDDSRIRVVDSAGNDVGTWSADDARMVAVALGDDMVVASVIEHDSGLRTLRAACLPDGVMIPVGRGDGVTVRPVPTSWGTVAMLRQVGEDFFVYERELRCTDAPAQDRGAPAAWALVPVLVAFALMRRQ